MKIRYVSFERGWEKGNSREVGGREMRRDGKERIDRVGRVMKNEG